MWQCTGLPFPNESFFGNQKSWDRIKQQAQFDNLLEHANQLDRARLLAAKRPESGAWLNAFPIPSLGTHLEDNAFRIAIAQRIGSMVCVPHKCRCGGSVDSLGLHPLSCRFNSGRAPRHAEVNDIIRRALQSAGFPSILEPVGLSRNDGKRPDGMTTFPLRCGKPVLWDFTCVDTFSSSHIIDSAIEAGSTANAAEEAKIRKYSNLNSQYFFQPVAVETSGAYGCLTKQFVKFVGSKITENTGDPRETLWLQQRIAVAIIRGNALSVSLAGR